MSQFITSQFSNYLIDSVVVSALVFCAAVTLASVARLLNLWLNARIAALIGSDLSCSAYKKTLELSYEQFIETKSSDIITSSTTYISQAISSINAFLQLLTASLITFAIFLAIFLASWKIAVSSLVVFLFSYILIAFTIKQSLSRMSYTLRKSTTGQSSQEGIGSIRI